MAACSNFCERGERQQVGRNAERRSQEVHHPPWVRISNAPALAAPLVNVGNGLNTSTALTQPTVA